MWVLEDRITKTRVRDVADAWRMAMEPCCMRSPPI
jgi:hypothetical protein